MNETKFVKLSFLFWVIIIGDFEQKYMKCNFIVFKPPCSLKKALIPYLALTENKQAARPLKC